MYECRCTADGKKLAEMARPPLPDLTYRYRCCCGRDRTVPASIDPVTHLPVPTRQTGRIIARANCACGREVEGIRKRHPAIHPFPGPGDLIAFLHDRRTPSCSLNLEMASEQLTPPSP